MNDQLENRLLSLDFFRGFTMFLLIAEWTVLFDAMVRPELEGSLIYLIGEQLHHHPWNGFRFWDLIQPFFMVIVGVAIPYSVKNRTLRGDNYVDIRIHAIKRSLILFVLGWALYCIGPGQIKFNFQNVLAQLGVTYIIAFLLMKRTWKTQFIISICILIVVEIIYRAFPIAGFDQPFTPGHNFGAWFDMLIAGELSGGHWVSFNAFPTTAHTMWGVIIGQFLMSDKSKIKKFKTLIIVGLVGIVAGLILGNITPIIKRISTSSFVIYSGGWTVFALAISYWVIDIMKIHKWTRFLIILGMNPLFIYIFAHVGGADLIHSIVNPFSTALFCWMGVVTSDIITGFIVWFCLWYITYWMYKRKIFIRI
ncbi:acyltransferase family protein [Candidatus Neomarinimicrobiota bacterium]